MKKSSQEGFTKVRTKLDFVYNIVFQRVPESATAQEYVSISIEPRARNVQIPPTTISTGHWVLEYLPIAAADRFLGHQQTVHPNAGIHAAHGQLGIG